jgi:ATP-dependent RNA helicase DHX36
VGILLRRLQNDPWLKQVSHVLVDEVHERDLMTDFLLILLKELVCMRSDLRVILMSATLDVNTFTNYFWGCSCLEVPTGPRYEVEEVHLEDSFFAARWAGDLPAQLLHREAEARQAAEEAREQEQDEDVEGEGADEPAYRSSTGIWWGSTENDETYLELLARLVIQLAEGPALVDDEGVPGSVLCFLPGWAEIKICLERLQQADRSWQKLWVLPIHSTLPKEEQQKNFRAPSAGEDKGDTCNQHCGELSND